MLFSPQHPLFVAGTLGVLALGVSSPASADTRDFPFTYEWRQGPKGDREFEVKSTYNGLENSFKQEIEIEVSVSDRLLIAPYVILEKEGDQGYKYRGFKLESRYPLGKFRRDKFLPGLYLEFERERGEASNLEGKIIFSRYGSDGSNLSFNAIASRALENGSEFGTGYSLGYARNLARNGLRGGLELIHDLSEHRINAGPVLSRRFGAFSVVGGYAARLNSRNRNADQIRVNVEYEF